MTNYISRGLNLITDPMARFDALTHRGFFDHYSDEKFLKAKWKAFYGEDLDLENPKSLCEK